MPWAKGKTSNSTIGEQALWRVRAGIHSELRNISESRRMDMATDVTVPMVGKIISIQVKVGDQVNENDQIATLEAMKMEMPVVAPVGGVVKEIKVEAGQEIDAETVIAIIE
jgi:biotin carboxyl carrier protein